MPQIIDGIVCLTVSESRDRTEQHILQNAKKMKQEFRANKQEVCHI